MALHSQNCSGKFPEFGAIFMSNRRTKRECLERQIFGLPLQDVDFVKNVRAGTILFLFEHEKRELHGVFEAISDGGVDIVPHAYLSSGRAFPAQVQFRVMWECDPLPERCFQRAIQENYYAAHKFSFNLSREQVHRLLSLFDGRRVGPQISLEEEKVEKRPSRSLDKESLSFEPGNQIKSYKLHCTPRKFQSADAQISNHKPGNTSPRSDLMQPQVEIKQIDIPESHLMDWGDFVLLSSPEEHYEHEGDLDHKPCLKDLYSDVPERKSSVFSRLKPSLQDTTKQEKGICRTMELTESVEEVMQNLQLKHDNWVKMRKKGDTRTFHDIDNPVHQRSGIFSRLSFTSETTQKNTRTDDSCSRNTLEVLSKFKRNKKRKHFATFTDRGHGQHNSMTAQVNTIVNRLANAEAPVAKGTTENKDIFFQENMSLPVLPSVPCKYKSGETEQNIYISDSVCQRRSVFLRLSFASEPTAKNIRTGNLCNTMEDMSKGKEKRKYAGSLIDHGSQCFVMLATGNMLENSVAIAESPVAEEATENENGSFEENMTLPAVTLVSCEDRSGEIEKCATPEERKMRDLDDAPGVNCKISERKIFITYKRKKRCLSMSSLV